jgi:hypothetical protein
MAYCFRIRFHLGQRVRIGSSETRLVLTSPDAAEEVALQSTDPEKSLQDVTQLALRGQGYKDEHRTSPWGATLFVREAVQVIASDSDQDDFVRNRVTLLGEGRFALAIWQPSAFAVVDLAA